MLQLVKIGERIYKFLGYGRIKRGKRFSVDKNKLVLKLLNWKELSYYSSEPSEITTTQDHLDRLKEFKSTKIEYIYDKEKDI